MYYLIENGSIRWPDPAKHGISVSEEAKDLIEKLLDKNKETRLGFKDDVNEVLAHPWFASLDREKLMKK
jgi:serine/threonine protein kinase